MSIYAPLKWAFTFYVGFLFVRSKGAILKIFGAKCVFRDRDE